MAEYDSTGAVTKRYVHGPGIDEPIVQYDGAGTANKSWFYADQQGSIVALANTTGAATATYTYGPYGEAGGTAGGRFRYTGQQYIVQTGFMYYKARMYATTLGRFLQPDPIGYDDDINLYAYVGNDPVNRTDPDGLAATLTGATFASTAAYNGIRAGATTMAAEAAGVSGLPFVLPLALSGDTPNREEYKYVTYTRLNPATQQIYSGITGGYGDPQTIANTRAVGQPHLNGEGFNKPIVDQSSTNYAAIRGREQQLIDFYGGAQSVGGTTRNMINGVSDYNLLKNIYLNNAISEFGPLPNNRPQR